MVVIIDTDYNVAENWPNLSYATIFQFFFFNILYNIQV